MLPVSEARVLEGTSIELQQQTGNRKVSEGFSKLQRCDNMTMRSIFVKSPGNACDKMGL
jgi:hypothetical protein